MTLAAAAPEAFNWQRFPETEALIGRLVASALNGNAFAAELDRRLLEEASVHLVNIVDHLVLTDRPGLVAEIERLGYHRDLLTYDFTRPVYAHEGGMFPRLAIVAGNGAEVREIAIKVESIADFSRHDLGLDVVGYALGPYRIARIDGASTSLAVVERRGYLGFDAFPSELAKDGRLAPQFARDALAAKDLWHGRKRRFDDDAEGFDHTEALLDRVIELCGGSSDLACHLIFEAERDYWQSRNRAARVQKARQDRLGIGWANHDHHTFRCSRRFFPRVIGIFRRLGFFLRERFHAGEHAGWGAQIVEHPTSGIVIFADLDLAPEEATHDFSRDALPNLPKPNTVGLWVGLHGESMLEAGMHHLEAQFDFDKLRLDLEAEAEVVTMPPFSNFPFLRQAFTRGERWVVSKVRADRLLADGRINAEQHAKFITEGAIGSHLENLQRTEGYKGFNQQAVSAIIAATDPRLQSAGAD